MAGSERLQLVGCVRESQANVNVFANEPKSKSKEVPAERV